MDINTREMGFLNFNEEDMQWLKVDGVIVYEAWKKLNASGVPPLTLTKCKGVDLIDYKIYGNSKQETKNILTFPYKCGNGNTNNGITYTVNSDGSVVANGTATANSSLDIGAINFEAGKTYTIYHAPSGASSSTYRILVDGVKNIYEANHTFKAGSNMSVHMFLVVASGQTVENLKFYPMVVEGDSIDNWQGFEPTPDTPIEVESVGDKTKNLINPKASLTTLIGVYKGIDVTKYINQNVILSISLKEGKSVPKGIYFGVPYYQSGSPTQSLWFVNNGEIKYNAYNLKQLADFYPNLTIIGIGVYPATQASWDKIFDAFDVQLEFGTKATDYEPYGYKIPVKASNDDEEITTNIYLNEPLRKVGDYADYIDFKKQKVFKNVEVIDNTGTLSLEESLNGVTDDVGTNIELPNIPTFKGTTILSVDTTIQPSNLEVVYKGKK